MDSKQIAKLMETERRISADPRKGYWHYRRTPATRDRDAIWQYANRPSNGHWETIPTPPMEVLERLEKIGRPFRDGHITWHGFHDPVEYDQGN